MLYIPVHYRLYEVVPKLVFETIPAAIIWRLFDDRILFMADVIWEHFGGKEHPVTINSWHWGGPLDDCGLRTPQSDTGEWTSQHRRGAALDHHIKDIAAEEARQEIIKNREKFKFITRLEVGPTIDWVHADTANTLSPDGVIVLFQK